MLVTLLGAWRVWLCGCWEAGAARAAAAVRTAPGPEQVPQVTRTSLARRQATEDALRHAPWLEQGTLQALDPRKPQQAEQLRSALRAGEPALLGPGVLHGSALQDAWTLAALVRASWPGALQPEPVRRSGGHAGPAAPGSVLCAQAARAPKQLLTAWASHKDLDRVLVPAPDPGELGDHHRLKETECQAAPQSLAALAASLLAWQQRRLWAEVSHHL